MNDNAPSTPNGAGNRRRHPDGSRPFVIHLQCVEAFDSSQQPKVASLITSLGSNLSLRDLRIRLKMAGILHFGKILKEKEGSILKVKWHYWLDH